MTPMDGIKRIAPTRLLRLPGALVIDVREYAAREYVAPEYVAPEYVAAEYDVREYDVRELAARESDVREHGTRRHGVHVPAPFANVLRVPMSELSDRLRELPDETLYIVCEWGLKSRRVVAYLSELGFDAVDVDGGLAALDALDDEDASAGVSTA